jgi:nucleoside-diphosphate kinase
MERTLVLIKPDGVQRGLAGEILRRFEFKGLRLVASKMLHMSRDLAERHYAVHKGKPFYEPLVEYITSGPVVAFVLEGKRAVAVVRTLMGPTDGAEAQPGTIRGDFAMTKSNNLIHGSDAVETANTEIKLFFQPEELLSYERPNDYWVYGTED